MAGPSKNNHDIPLSTSAFPDTRRPAGLTRRQKMGAGKKNLTLTVGKLDRADEKVEILHWAQLKQGENSTPLGIEASRALLVASLLKNERSAVDLYQRLSRKRNPPRRKTFIDRYADDVEETRHGNRPDPLIEQRASWLKAWQEEQDKPLTEVQCKVLSELIYLRKQIKVIYSHSRHLPSPKDKPYKQYDAAIRKAINLGLENHPDCIEWLMHNQSLSNRGTLHTVSRRLPGAERGAGRIIPLKESVLLKEICQLREKGRSLRSIYAHLRAQGAYNKTWNAFHKWVSDPIRTAIIEPL